MTLPQRSDVWPHRTARLEIRPCTIDDLDAVWKFRQLPDVNRWLGLAPATRDAFIERYSAPERLANTFVVELLPEGSGDRMVRIEDGWGQLEVVDDTKGTQAELGWVLDPAFTGHGYASEAVRGLIDVCFGPLGLRRVHAGCFADNEPSWRLMERIGMRREEYSHKTALHRSGEWMDGMNYGLLAEEWSPAS